jgi:cobalamin biosynthesis Mg chelatase CobN
MADAEIRRNFDRIDRAIQNAVTLDAWTRENEHVRDQMHELDRDCRERTDDVAEAAKAALQRIEGGKQNAWTRGLQVAGVVATVVVGWWTAYIASKGLK